MQSPLTREPKRLWIGALPAFLVVAFLLQCLHFISNNSQTYDEAVHLVAGYSYVSERDFRLNLEHPPLVKTLCALPVYLCYAVPLAPIQTDWRASDQWTLGFEFLYRSEVHADKLLGLARMPNVILGTTMVALVGIWSFCLWGRGGAILGMTLAAFDPNLIAHSSLVTTDAGAALFSFAALFLLWKCVASPSWSGMAAVGIAVGLALASKYSMVFLPVVLVAACGLALFDKRGVGLSETKRLDKPSSMWGAFAGAIISLFVIAYVALIVLWSAYFFQDPYPYFEGLTELFRHQDRGHPAFFCGSYSSHGWPMYFPVAFLIKTPIGTLILIATSLLMFKSGKRFSWLAASFLLVPLAIYFAVATQARINIGIRHLLHIYPICFVIASRVATISISNPKFAFAMCFIAVAVNVASSVRVSPHQIAYFNELIGGPKNGYQYLSDSNLDWGQDLKNVSQFLNDCDVSMIYLCYFGNAPPEYYDIRARQLPGFGAIETAPSHAIDQERQLLAISAFNLQGVRFADHDRYAWLLERRPIAQVGYSIFIYDISQDADAHINLARIYRMHGNPTMAERETSMAVRIDPDSVKLTSPPSWKDVRQLSQ